VTLTEHYRDRLAASTSGLLARLLVAWLVLYDPARPIWSAARVGELAATWIGGAQAFAADETTRWLAALTAQSTRSPLARVAPYAIPAGLIGTSAAGGPLAELTGLAPAVWWSRFTAGATREEAAAATAGWLGRLAASEPYRAANATTLFNARRDRRLTGRTRRDTRPGACSFCLALAARGFTSARAGFPAHGHCGCTAAPEIGSTR
jgi:hypothetical protein